MFYNTKNLNKSFLGKWLVSTLLLLTLFLIIVPSTVSAQIDVTYIGRDTASLETAQMVYDLTENRAKCITDPKACIAGFLASFGDVIIEMFGDLLTLSGAIFDLVVDKSLDVSNEGNIYSGQSTIREAWEMSRDAANLLFIFIILVIAIATILGLETYGAKALLPKLIIAAILINFSFLITTSFIIQPSNYLAKSFYDATLKIAEESSENQSVSVQGKPSISKAFVDGLNPSRIKTAFGKPVVKDQGIVATALAMFIATVGGSILIVVASFVLLVASAMFMWRIVVLWIIIALAPLAFLFMVLPVTQKNASKWWSELFSQAIFPTVFLFLFWIVVKIVSAGSVANIFGQSDLKGIAAILDPGYVLNYIFLIILLLLTITASKALGARGGNAIIGGGKTVQKWAIGYTGRLTARTLVGQPASRLRERSREAVDRFAAWSPILGGATRRTMDRLAGVGAMEEKIKQKVDLITKLPIKEGAETLSNLGFRDFQYAMRTLSPTTKGAIAAHENTSDTLKDRMEKQLDRMPGEERIKFAREWGKQEMGKPPDEVVDTWGSLPIRVKQFIYRESKEEQLKALVNAFVRAGKTPEFMKEGLAGEDSGKFNKAFINAIPNKWKDLEISSEEAVRYIDFEKIDEESAKEIAEDSELMSTIVLRATPKQARHLIVRGGSLSDEFVKRIRKEQVTSEVYAASLRRAGNRALAAVVETNEEVKSMIFEGEGAEATVESTPWDEEKLG